MSLRFSIGKPDIAGAYAGLESELAAASADAMRGATGTLKNGLRDQVRTAGLGNRLANTWRAETYPASGAALNPAGYAWSNAPAIIDAFASGAVIAPLGGRKYLWIPTRSVPRRPGGGRATSTLRMSPTEVEHAFNQDLIIRHGENGHLLAFIARDRGQTAKGNLRRVRKGRLAHGEKAELILMFTLVSTVRLTQLLDLQVAGNAAADDYIARLTDNLR